MTHCVCYLLAKEKERERKYEVRRDNCYTFFIHESSKLPTMVIKSKSFNSNHSFQSKHSFMLFNRFVCCASNNILQLLIPLENKPKMNITSHSKTTLEHSAVSRDNRRKHSANSYRQLTQANGGKIEVNDAVQ